MEELRHDGENVERRIREGTIRESNERVQRDKKPSESINLDQVIVDSARYLQVYDVDLILSWTPKQFSLLIKGARHKQIDDLEMMSFQAMMTAKASNAKRMTPKKLFDSEKAHRKVDKPSLLEREKEHIVQMNEAFKGFTPQFTPKGR